MTRRPNKPMTQRTILMAQTFQTIAFTALGAGLWYWSGRPLEDFLHLNFREAMLGLLLAGVMILVAYAAFRTFPRISEKLVRSQAGTYDFLRNRLSFPAVVWIAICAGVNEEALFRAGLQTLAGDYIGPVLAILASSALFALVHLAKPVVSAIIFAIGILFGVIYEATGSLLIVMIGHAVYDIFALAYLQDELHRLRVFDDEAEPAAS